MQCAPGIGCGSSTHNMALEFDNLKLGGGELRNVHVGVVGLRPVPVVGCENCLRQSPHTEACVAYTLPNRQTHTTQTALIKKIAGTESFSRIFHSPPLPFYERHRDGGRSSGHDQIQSRAVFDLDYSRLRRRAKPSRPDGCAKTPADLRRSGMQFFSARDGDRVARTTWRRPVETCLRQSPHTETFAAYTLSYWQTHTTQTALIKKIAGTESFSRTFHSAPLPFYAIQPGKLS